MFRIIGFFTLVTIVAANDLVVGVKDNGKKIVDEQRIASPAFWVQTANLTYNASDSEVISGVIVTDLRPNKDGIARIVEGGEGHKNVTIELKSPTMLRGYDFLVEVYAVSDNNIPSSTTEQFNLDVNTKEDAPKVPISLSGDTLDDNLRKTRKTADAESSTLKSLDITTAAASSPSTQAANDQSAPKSHDGDETKGDGVNTPVNIGKDVKQAIDVSSTPKTITHPIAVPNDTNVHSETNKAVVIKSDVDELKPIIPDLSAHEQFRNVRDSAIPAVHSDDYVTLTTGLTENDVSTESSSTVGADATTFHYSSEVVTVIDTLEALASKKDASVPRVLLSEDSQRNDQRYKIPIPYNH